METVKEINISEGNKLIAEFMGGRVYSGYEIMNSTNYCIEGDIVNTWRSKGFKTGGFEKKMLLNNALFHSSWEWLMECVEKIDSIVVQDQRICQSNATSHTFYIHYNYPYLAASEPSYNGGRHRAEGEDRIYNVYCSVVKFLEWYKLNSPTSPSIL